MKHRKLLAKQSIVSKETDSETTAAYGKRVEDAKRKSVKAAAEEEEDDSESEYPSEEETVTTVGRGLSGSHRLLNKNSGYYPAIFVRRDGECPLLQRLNCEEAALHNPRDLSCIKHPSKSKIPVDPTLPTYKDYGKQR